MRGSGPLTVAMAPEPADVIWENLQVSRTERYLRSFLSSAILTVVVVMSSTFITISGVVQQTENNKAFSGDGVGAGSSCS